MSNTYTLHRSTPTPPPVEAVTITLSAAEFAALRVLVGATSHHHLTELCKDLGNMSGRVHRSRKSVASLALSLTVNDYGALFTQLNVIANEIVEGQ